MTEESSRAYEVFNLVNDIIMGILDISAAKKITATFLKSNGFWRSYWGSPDGRKPSGKACWNKSRKFYEGFWTGHKDCLTLYWFPKGFDGYVVPFPGSTLAGALTAPAGTLLVSPQTDGAECIVYPNIFTEIDFLTVKAQLTKKYKIYQNTTDEGVF